MSYKLTTVAACRVARIDRQRFNEFVAAGEYPCAPDTIPGRSRLFGENDLVALFIFARLVEKQFRPLLAGRIACKVREALGDSLDIEIVALADAMANPRIDVVDRPGSKVSSVVVGGFDALSITQYNIACVRLFVREGVDEERQVIGAEDE